MFLRVHQISLRGQLGILWAREMRQEREGSRQLAERLFPYQSIERNARKIRRYVAQAKLEVEGRGRRVCICDRQEPIPVWARKDKVYASKACEKRVARAKATSGHAMPPASRLKPFKTGFGALDRVARQLRSETGRRDS